MFKNNLGNKEIMAENIKEQLEKRRITPKDLSRELDTEFSPSYIAKQMGW